MRKHWTSEAAEFTPWLAQAENIALLGRVIGMELEVQERECRVGPFRADILCAETGTEHKVLIENQLERTDHVHLGQLLTYAAGLDAVTIVWIAENFTDEHRAALDWLNRVTADGIDFFGLEIELWRIGESLPAPKFNLVVKPNEWIQAATDAELNDTQRLYLEYWTAFKEHLATNRSAVKPYKPAAQHWTTAPVGRTGFYFAVSVSTQKEVAAVQLVITGPDRLAHFKSLMQDRAEIERAIGSGLEWRELPEKKESQIRWAVKGLDPANRADWGRQHDLLRRQLDAMYRELVPRVKGLTTQPESAET